jgi:hypothetical protein
VIAAIAALIAVVAVGLFIWRRVVIARAAASNPAEDEDWPLPPLFVPPDLARAAAAAARDRAGEAPGRVAPVSWSPPPAAPPAAPSDAPPPAPPVTPAPGPAIHVGPAPLAAIPKAPSAPPPVQPNAPPQPPKPAPAVLPPRPAAAAAFSGAPVLASGPGGSTPLEEVAQEVLVGPVRFHRPPDGTLQLLPGRLEILRGSERLEEIRFVRTPGRDVVVTFGRSPGEAHKHVQLEARTVSRLHAAMRYADGQWQITNLSRTNPVVVNGEALAAGDEAARVLADGDHLEMGEVVFRFRTR